MKGSIMDELSTPASGMVTNPTYAAAGTSEVNRESNPLYETGNTTTTTEVPRRNNPMYETGEASVASYTGYARLDQPVYNIPTEASSGGDHYEVVHTRNNEDSVLVAGGVTNWAIPLHEQEC
eukprot:m.60230 g.60230  ORF g.60230 m.60230 type:complete len:122 (-) comp11305_c2_seq1:46-411(-)